MTSPQQAPALRSKHRTQRVTQSARAVDLCRPRYEDIAIQDIATHLSLICRFTGACGVFYSVAEHSVRASYIAHKDAALAVLLHDAAEAYIGDILPQIKGLPWAEPLREMERQWMEVIGEVYEYSPAAYAQEIHHCDRTMLATEVRDLMPEGCDFGHLTHKPLPLGSEGQIILSETWPPAVAAAAFLNRFTQLRGH